MIKDAFNRFILYMVQKVFSAEKYTWRITDHIIKVDEEVPDVKLPVNNSDDNEENKDSVKYRTKYMCMRSYSNTSIYVPMDKVKDFKAISTIYSEKYKLINVSNINRFRVLHDASAYVAKKVTPPAVKIKLVTCSKIDDVKVFVINVTDLDQSEELYKDLVSYKIMNERYKIE